MLRFLLAVVLAVTSAYAQQSARSATLTGFVTDPSGANIVGVKVTATNIETRFTAEGLTNETGRFSIPYLAPGPYELRAEAPGFRAYMQRGIELRAGESPRIDFSLEVGSVSESIEVTGRAPLLETETATSASSLQNETFMRIPILQSKVLLTLYYLPGVSGGTNPLGQRNSSLGNSLDGVNAKAPISGGSTGYNSSVQTSMDVLEEVRVMTTGVPAEYGRTGGGMVVSVMKSGTNVLHGAAEDRYVSGKMFHRSYFELLPDPTAFHQMSGNLSGPVVLPKIYDGRNRTFWLVGWYRHHETDNQPATTEVPSEEMLNGDFSFNGKGYPLYDPFSTRLEGSTWVRDPIPGNRISPSSFDPAIKKFLGYGVWAAPNRPGIVSASGVTENLDIAGWKHAFHSRLDVKVDHQVSSSHKFFVRYNWLPDRSHNREGANSRVLLPYLVAGMAHAPADARSAVFADTLTLSPTLINEFRISANRLEANRRPETQDQGWAQKLGIPNVGPETFPAFANLGYSVAPGGASKGIAEEFSLMESLLKQTGSHTFKMGWEASLSRTNNINQDLPSGSYTFGGTDFPFRTNTGNNFAAFLLGSVSSATFTQNRATWLPRFWVHGLYFQDDYRPTRNLTVNLGLRWGYQSPYSTRHGQQSQFDPTVTDPVTGKMGAITHPKGLLAKRDLNNFQPRLGVAWTFRPKFVFRGSYAVMTQDLNASTNMAFEDYVATATVQSPAGDPRIVFRLSQGPPTITYKVNPDGSVPFVGTNFSTRNASWYDSNMRMPYVMTWSGSIQYQFASTWLLETSYQGSSGNALLNNWDINAIPLDVSTDRTLLDKIYAATQNYKPYTQFGSIQYYSNFGHSTYHSGTLRLEKRYSHGLTLNTFYTFSKALNNSDSEGSATGITFYNRSLEKGLAGYDLPHRFVNVITYDLPFGVGRRFASQPGWGDRLIGGWRLTWSDCLQSGQAFSLSFGGSPSKYLPGVKRPNIIVPLDQAYTKDWTIGPNRFPSSAENPYLNAAAFAYPDAYTAGNLGRNTFRTPYLYWPQGSLSKQWQIYERLKLVVRWDVNNPFKHANFSPPGSSYDTKNLASFARFTGTRGSISTIGGKMYHLIVFRLEF